MHPEYDERIVIYLTAEHIDYRCQMLTRDCPVRTITLHLQVTPPFREYLQTTFAGNVQHFRSEFPVEQTRNQSRTLHQSLYKCLYLFRKKRRNDDADFIRSRPTSFHLSGYDIIFQLNFFDIPFTGISSSTRNAVFIVYMRK